MMHSTIPQLLLAKAVNCYKFKDALPQAEGMLEKLER